MTRKQKKALKYYILAALYIAGIVALAYIICQPASVTV